MSGLWTWSGGEEHTSDESNSAHTRCCCPPAALAALRVALLIRGLILDHVILFVALVLGTMQHALALTRYAMKPRGTREKTRRAERCVQTLTRPLNYRDLNVVTVEGPRSLRLRTSSWCSHSVPDLVALPLQPL